MNTKLLILLLIGGAGISAIGVLTNDINVNVQSFQVFDSVDTFTEGFECACKDPNGSGIFSGEFCDVTYLTPPDPNDPNDPGVPNPNSLGAVGNYLCTWETSEEEYGGGLNQEDEGCSARFWEQYSVPSAANYVWPPGYNPDDKYADVFFIDFYYDPAKATGVYANWLENFDSEGNEIIEFNKGMEKIKELIKNSMENGKIKRSTAYSLLWLLDSSLDYDKRGHSDKAIKKFGDFIKRVNDDRVLDQDDDKYVKQLQKKIEKGIDHFKKRDSFTLMDALSNENSNSIKYRLAKQSVAALLNSGHSEVNYPYSIKEVMMITQDGFYGGSGIKVVNEFTKYNNAGGSSLCS